MAETFKDAEQFKAENGYEINGAWYPRVTRIAGIKAKPSLLYYYAAAPDYRTARTSIDESAREGTMVHEAAEAILLGQEPEVHPRIAPAIAAFRAFLDDTPITTESEYVERRIVNREHRYAGTVDALATIAGRFGVLDIKTSQAIYRDYDLQTAAYLAALQPEFENLATRWILRIDQLARCARCGSTRRVKGGRVAIRRNGGFACAPDMHAWGDAQGVVELKEIPERYTDFEAFLGAKRLWEWENEEWLSRIGYFA